MLAMNLLVSLFVQLKVVVVELQEPTLLFVATKRIEVGDEILFDYNDKESRLPFLKSCPVCQSSSDSRKRRLPENDDNPANTKRRATETNHDEQQAAGSDRDITGGSDSAGGDDESAAGSDSASGSASASTSASTSASDCADDIQSTVSSLAEKRKLTKEEREQLFAAVREHFPQSTVVSRSILEQWHPNIHPENVQYILMRRNKEAANRMIQKVAVNTRQRQQKILDSFKK